MCVPFYTVDGVRLIFSQSRMAYPCRFFVALTFASLASLTARADCLFSPTGTATVGAVRDGRTLQLADGRTLRLAAIETESSAPTMLERLAAGRAIRFMPVGPKTDRYGRVYAFAATEDQAETLQAQLIKAGAARVSGRVGDLPCAKSLLLLEKIAREAHLGLWADPGSAPLAADNLPAIRAKKGRFVLVEGKVLSAHQSGGTIYLNFGRHWTRDFSVVILRRNKRLFAGAGRDPDRLEGRRVRIRGWVELRRGPVIEAERPEQIEFIDDDGRG